MATRTKGSGPTLADGLTELAKRQQAKARTGLLAFTEYTFPDFPGGSYEVNWHHEVICSYLDRVLSGEIKRLILCAPPRRGKTELAVRRLASMAFGLDPDIRIMACSYGADLATDNSRDVKKIINTGLYRELFPSTTLNPKRADTDEKSGAKNTADQWEIVGHHGAFLARGVGGGIAGKGFDLGIIDDPVKNLAEASSEVHRRALYGWYKNEFDTRQAPGAAIVLMMTRRNQFDLIGRLIDDARKDPDADQWVVVNIREIREDDDFDWDPREPGAVLWPDRYTLAKAQERERNDPAIHASLFQQHPSPPGGAIIQHSWMVQRYRYGAIDPTLPGEWRIYGDLKNGSKQPKSSYAVFEVWFRPLAQRARRYLVEQVRGRWDQAEEEHALTNLVERFPQCGPKKLENKADSAGVIVHLADTIDGLVACKALPGSKEDRLRACSHLFAAGNVWLPEGAPWLPEYVHEMTAFPASANDDQVDTTTLALNDWTDARSGHSASFWSS